MYRWGGGIVLGLATAGAWAQVPAPEDLDQRLKVLERKLELAEEDAAKTSQAPVSAAGEKGFSLQSAKGDYDLKLRALVQSDGRWFLSDEGRFNDTFILRRLRPTFEGTVGRLVGFRLTPEFAGDSATIVDAYVDLKFHPLVTLRTGKVKGPVALERLQSGSAITFIERGFPSELAPNRDIGVQLQGETAGKTFSYVVGLYNGTADGRDAATRDVDNRKELAARVFFEPFRSDPGFLQGLGFGVGGSTGSKFGNLAGQGGVLPQYRTPGQNTFFQYSGPVAATDTAPAIPGVAANGTHTRLSPQFYLYRNRFGLLGEYIASSQELSRGAVSAEVENTAWQLVASWVVTGEDATFRGVTPASPYAIGADGWGAFEVAARHGRLAIDDAAFERGFASIATSAREASDVGIALNWYPTANAKLGLNFDQTGFTGGAAGGSDRNDEQALFARVQLTY